MLARLGMMVRNAGAASHALASPAPWGALSVRYASQFTRDVNEGMEKQRQSRRVSEQEDVPREIAEGVFKHFVRASPLEAGWKLKLPQTVEGPLLLRRKNARTLAKVFAHPMNMNIRWRDVETLLKDLGAEVVACGSKKRTSAGGVRVTLKGVEPHTFPNHALHDTNQLRVKEEILAIRRMMQQAGIVEKNLKSPGK